MRMLLVSSGANTSIRDVDRGYLGAFARLGVRVIHYDLEHYLRAAGRFLQFMYDEREEAVLRGMTQDHLREPDYEDVGLRGSSSAVERAVRAEGELVLAR